MSCPDDFFAKKFLPHYVELLFEVFLDLVTELHQKISTLSN